MQFLRHTADCCVSTKIQTSWHKKKQHRLVGRLAVPAVVLILVLSTVFIFFYRKEYKPLIVDHNPSVYTYEDLVSDTDLLKSRYSSVFSADSLGETADGRQILHFIIGNEDASRKILVNGGIHAREYITCQLVMKQTVSFLKHIKAEIPTEIFPIKICFRIQRSM